MSKIFIDSNIWIYLFTADDHAKSAAAKDYISVNAQNNRLVISFQVVNEVCSVLKKKKYSESVIRRVADDMLNICEVCNYSADILFIASKLRENYSFSYYDSQIVSSALFSQCDILASEDMQDRLSIDKLTILNIFKL